MKKYSAYILSLLLILFFASCKEDPSGIGSDILPDSDKLIIKTINNITDSIQITSDHFDKNINTGNVAYLLLGRYKNYEAFSILKITDIPDTLSTYNVLNAQMVLYPSTYSLDNTSDPIFVSAYNMITQWSGSNLDSLSKSTINYNPSAAGTFSGSISDSMLIVLNPTLIKEWFFNAADSARKSLNQGIILASNSGTGVIRSFYSYESANKIPFIRVIIEKNGKIDSLIFQNFEDGFYLKNNNISYSPILMYVQSGNGINSRIRFNLDKIPKHCFISNATLTLTLQSSTSMFGIGHVDSLVASFVIDPVSNTTNYLQLGLPQSDDQKRYVFNITPYVQDWVNGKTNNGIDISSFAELINADLFTLYSENEIDKNKIPKLTITYFTAPK